MQHSIFIVLKHIGAAALDVHLRIEASWSNASALDRCQGITVKTWLLEIQRAAWRFVVVEGVPSVHEGVAGGLVHCSHLRCFHEPMLTRVPECSRNAIKLLITNNHHSQAPLLNSLPAVVANLELRIWRPATELRILL